MRAVATATARLPYAAAESKPSAGPERGSGKFTVSLIHDFAGLRERWLAFQEAADCTVFQTFEWLCAYRLHIGIPRGEMPCIALVHAADGSIACLLPLAIRRSGFARELTFFGSELCDYNAPLLAPGFFAQIGADGFQRLWRDLLTMIEADPRTRFDIVRLEKMPAHVRSQCNPLVAYLPTALNPSGSWATPLADTWDAFYAARRSPATRSRDRSKLRRLAECGEIVFRTPDSTDAISRALDVLMKQKGRAFAERGIGNIFMKPGYADFYRAVATDSGSRDIVHVSQLDVGAETAAVALGLMFRGRYYYVLSSYTSGPMARFGPGAIHLHRLMRYAIERGMTVFDFTIGDERYKRDWCDSMQPLHDHVATQTARGTLVAAVLRTARRAKRAVKQNSVLWDIFSKGRKLVAGGRSAP
jgi:CelD/BcsL family acetyltransferase involved in cellulose biosynthesis